MQGTVKMFDPATSEGIVVRDTDRDEFVLAADALEGSLFRMLRQGQRVVFDLDADAPPTSASAPTRHGLPPRDLIAPVITVRDATPRTYRRSPRCTSLETTTHEWTEIAHTVAEREQWLSDQRAAGRPALVAIDSGAVVGWATYGDFRDSERWPGYRYTVEHSIHVREDRWGRGVGRELVKLRSSSTLGPKVKRVMVAGIDGDNTGSIRFHERLGFFEVGRMPEIGEKFGRRLDLVLMQLILDEPSRERRRG